MPNPALNINVADKRLDPGVLGLLSRFEVRESDVDPTVAALRFRLVQQDSGEFRPIDDDVFTPSAALQLDVTPQGGLPRRLFDGFVSHVRPHFETIESNCYVEVIAMDAAMLLDAYDRVASYPDSSDRDAVEAVFQRYDIELSGDDTTTMHEEKRSLLVQRSSDWAFVQRMARRNGFVCFLEHDADAGKMAAYFGRPRLEGEAQPDLAILQRGDSLLWFDAQLMMTGPVRYGAAALNPLTAELIKPTTDEEQEEAGEGGLADAIERGLTEAGAEAAEAWVRDPLPIDTALTAAVVGYTDRDRFAVEARGELDPALYRGLIQARRPVLIRGVGRRLSGTWYVRAVRTTMEDGALRQTFVAARNSLGQSGRESFGQQAEEVPPQ